MRTTTFLAALAPASLLFVSNVAAQASVHVVDAGGGFDFTTIQAAIDGAANGDTVLVKSGIYDQLVIDGKAISVVAEKDAKVLVTGTGTGADVVAVRNLGNNGRVIIRGIDVVPFDLGLEGVVALENNAGTVWVEDLTVTPSKSTSTSDGSTLPDAMVVVENCAAVNLTRIDVTGNAGYILFPSGLSFLNEASRGADAVRADNSTLSIWDSELQGGIGSTATFGPTDAPIPATVGGEGLEIRGGSLFASNTSFQGGEGGGANVFFWGCLEAADGGAGILLESADPQVTSRGSTFAGGAGGAEGVCSPQGQDGLGVDVQSGTSSTLPGSGRSLNATSPHREGESSTLTYAGEANELVFNAIGGVQLHALLPTLGGVLLTAPLAITAVGTADGSGALTVPSPIPAFGNPAREVAHVYLQSIFVDVSGGPFPEVTLGSGSVLSILDASL